MIHRCGLWPVCGDELRWAKRSPCQQNSKRIRVKRSKRICLDYKVGFLLPALWIYAYTSFGFVKTKSRGFSIFCCQICDRNKYWNPDNFTICISVNLIGSSSKTNADHLSPFCPSNSQYSMFPFQMYFPDGPDSSSIPWYTRNSNGTEIQFYFDTIYKSPIWKCDKFKNLSTMIICVFVKARAGPKVCSNKMFLVSFSELWSRTVYTVKSWRQQMLSYKIAPKSQNCKIRDGKAQNAESWKS